MLSQKIGLKIAPLMLGKTVRDKKGDDVFAWDSNLKSGMLGCILYS